LLTQVWLWQRVADQHLSAAGYRVIGRRSRGGPARRTDRTPCYVRPPARGARCWLPYRSVIGR